MFTRRIIMKIKSGSAAEAGRIFEDEVIPLLRRQKGMRHEDIFINRELSESVLNSYWDTQEYAEDYSRATYPAALKSLSEVLEGTPQVETFGISSSTFHWITARRREAYKASQLGRGGRTLEIGVYETGDLSSDVAAEVNDLDDVNVRAALAGRRVRGNK